MKKPSGLAALFILALTAACIAIAQSLGNAGTITGTVTDPSGAAVPKASVTILNRVTDYHQSTTTDDKGAFRFTNIPPNPYHLEASVAGFAAFSQDVEVRGAVPIDVPIKLAVAGSATTVVVHGEELLENVYWN